MTPGQRRLIASAQLGALLRSAGDQLSVPSRASLSVRLTDDAELRELNRRFAGVDEPTDVLAFPATAEQRPHAGDVAISVERAARQAPGRVEDELRLLAVHGLLHCLGHDHAEPRDAARMTRLSRALLPGQPVPDL